MGGLGIGCLLQKNKALLFKWLWRLMNQNGEQVLWEKVITDKYELQPGMFPHSLRPYSHFSPIWKQIWLTIYERPFCDGIKFLLGNGDRIIFWDDIWIFEEPLKLRFPRLFGISMDQSLSVKDMGFWDGYNWEWCLRWSRPLRSWELDQANSLLCLLNSLNYSPDCKDRVIWLHDHKGLYSVKSASLALSSNLTPPIPFSAKGIWRNLAPPKVEIFLWMTLMYRLNTKASLLQKGIINPSVANCSFCNLELETVDHLFVLCPLVQAVWYSLMKWWGLAWVSPTSLRSLFE